MILARLRQSTQVTFETVAGALCIYLIFGLVFAGILFTISLATNRKFLVAGLDSTTVPSPAVTTTTSRSSP